MYNSLTQWFYTKVYINDNNNKSYAVAENTIRTTNVNKS